jgi:parallel beta-helix repeat protein
MKKLLLFLIALVFVTQNVWTQNLQKSQKKIFVHEQISDNPFNNDNNGGLLDNYGSPGFDNPYYYYAAVKTAPSGVYYRQAGLSPNGQKLIAQKSFTDGSYSRIEIVLMNADGSGETIISAGNSGEGDIYGYMNPFWSDDGSAIGFAEVHNTSANKIIRYMISSATTSYIYAPSGGLDACNPDFVGNSTTTIVFWDWIAADGAADLFTWDGSTLTNITNSTAYSEYEPVSNSDGTVILYWSGETATEPVNTTHTLTYSGGVWTKDVAFTPISDSYWAYWSGQTNNNIGVTVMSSKDICIYDNTGNFIMDLTGPGYSGGSGQWNFIGFAFEGENGELVMTTNAGRGTTPGRDIVFASLRTNLFANSSLGSDLFPGTKNAPFATIGKAITESISGGTVNVAAGTYDGNITINKSLTLVGDPGNTDPGPGTNVAIVDGGSAPGDAFLIANGVTNVTIKGFEMRNFTSPLMNGIGNGISAWEASTSNITVQDNYFHDLGYNGILVGNDGAAGDHTYWTVKKNIVENCGYIGFELTNTSNSTIEDNIIHLNTPYIGAIFSSARRSETGLSVLNNIIDGTPSTSFPVIYMYAYDLDMPNPNLNNVLIQGNDIQTSGTPYQVYIRNIGTGTVTGVIVDHNKLKSLKNLTSSSIDADGNYWGSIYPFDFIAKINGNVDFDPWCNSDFSTCTYSLDGGPITYAGKVVATGSTVTVPITVTSFNDIDAISLTLVYNPSVLTYTGFDENTALSNHADMLGNATGGKVILSWNGNVGTGVSLSDNAVLVNIYFTVIGGTSLLTWFDDDEINCEYQNAILQYPYNDDPTSTYYINGWVTDMSVTFTRTYDPAQTITAVVAGGTGTYTYSWTGPGGFTAGNVATITPANGYGDYIVTITDGLGAILIGTYYYGPVHNINTYFDYAAIQGAIDAVITVNGHTLVADAGTYHERINVSKSLDIRGAQFNMDPTVAGARTNPANESIIDLVGLPITNPNVMIEIPSSVSIVSINGFTLNGSQIFHYADEAVVRSWNNGISINNNIIDGYFNLLLKGGSNLTANSNRMITNKAGVTIQPNPATVVMFLGNTIIPGTSPAADASGIYITGVSNGTISGNVISGFVGGNGIGGSNISQIDILENKIYGNKKGINIWGTTTFIEIDANEIYNSIERGIDIKGADLSITNNFTYNNGTEGIRIAYHVIPTVNVLINDNSIVGNGTYGLLVDAAVTQAVGATCNWWGTSTVSGVTAAISGLATFDPWLIDGSDIGDPGFVPGGSCTGATDLYVNDLVSDNGTNDIYTFAIGSDANPGTALLPFLTITNAVNTAVDGTNIWVDAGTFQEQVQIGKTLNMTGVDSVKTIILAPATLPLTGYWYSSPYTSQPIVYAYGTGNTINISKLCIDGGGGRDVDHYIGMEYYEANGTFDQNKITGIHDVGVFTGMQRGHAFYGMFFGTNIQTLNITNNLVIDYQKGGIYVDGAGDNTDVLIDGNRVIGQGVANVTAQNGISPAWCDVTVTNNLVTNNIWNIVEHPHVWMASGIMLYETETSNVYGNTMNGNEVGLWGYNTVTPTYGINTFNNNKVHVYEDVTAHDPDFIYDKRVDNPAQPEAVFGCIQYAIDEATPAGGDVLNVSAHTFIENVVVHTPVSINGAGMTSTTVLPAFSGCVVGAGSSLPPGSSNVFLVQANGVTIQNLTIDGNNPSLTSGVLSNGVDVDARNGIITDHTTGSWTNLIADNVKIQNIYLRGFYSSAGGYFEIKNSTVINVEGEIQSQGIMNWAGTGLIKNNNVSQADICSNHSAGVIYEYNTVTNSGGGIHTDNNGFYGGIADIIRYNNVSLGTSGSYGIWVFASYRNTQVYENTVSGVSVGLCASGQFTGVPVFSRNTVTGNETGIYTTTSLFEWGSSNCNATFTNNFIDNNTVNAFEIESEAGYTNNTTANENHIVGNLLGVNVISGGTTNANMTCNWWGTTDGDLIAPMMSGTVNYIPWLVNGADNDLLTAGFQPVPGSCTGAPDLTGNYKYYNPGLTALTNIKVELWPVGGTSKVYPLSGDPDVVTNGSGVYTFTNVLPNTYEVHATTLKAVGGINSTDAAQVNYWGVTPSSIEKVRWLSGDVAGTDFKVNANDALLIQNYFLTQGNPSTPFNSTWSFWSVGELIGSNPGVSLGFPQVIVPAVGTTVSKNFYGLVTGDFNRSFTPSALKSGSESLTLSYGQTIEVGEDAFEFPLYAAMDMTVGAVSLILNIPSDLLQVNNVYLGSDPNTPVLYDVTGNELRISWYSSESLLLQTGQRLLTLELQAIELTGDPIYLSLASDPLNELADQNFDVFNAQLTVDIIKTTALGLGENPLQNNLMFSNHPNPFVGTTNFVYTIPVDGKVLLEVFDILGNKVMEAVNETQSAGEYLLKVDRTVLQPGIYMATLRLESAGNNVSRTIKIISK